ncbi:MAG: DUF4982 domain-containing protein [Spirochaetales bacterium]|nr:DUF4982 domain-containing protein [Spirochaetales bacterium]
MIPEKIPEQSPFKGTDIYNGLRGKSFNTGWRFYYGDPGNAEDPGFNDSPWQLLDLPHDYSIRLPFNKSSPAGPGGGYLDGGTGWYRKAFTLPEEYSDKRITIQFDGIYMNSEVWINGIYLGIRPYGYSSFEYHLTSYLNSGKIPNVIAVKVNNNQPNSRWYSGSGIYRNVWLTVTGPVHIAYCGMTITTPAVGTDSATVRIATIVENHSDADTPVRLFTEILDPDGNCVGTSASPEKKVNKNGQEMFIQEIAVRNPQLWSTGSPDVYTAQTSVRINANNVDKYKAGFGFRTIRFDADTGFYLNDVNMKLNGVCLHHDLGALGAAVNYRAIERQLVIMKEMGCNAIRTSHNPPAPMLLDLCDRLGFVVIDEAFDAWKESKVQNDYHLNFDIWAREDIKAMVRRDRNHPCIIMWSIGNEIHDVLSAEGVATARNLITWVKEEDATRFVTHGGNHNEKGTDAAALLDVVGYNYITHLYDIHHKKYPGWKMYASETSSAVRSRGIYKTPTDENILEDSDYQCSSYDNSIVDWGSKAIESYKMVNDRPWVAGEFIWTGFDYIGEPTPYEWPSKNSYFGIVDTAGFPKDIYYFYKSRWTKKPVVHLLPHWNWEKGQTIEVHVYSNCESIELFLNNKSLGQKRFTGADLFLCWNVPYEPGILKAVARQNGNIITANERKTAGPPAKLRMIPDRSSLFADNNDLVFIEVTILDKDDVIVPYADTPVFFSLSGPGRIAGVDNGNSINHEPYKGSRISAFNGKCLLIIQATSEAGQIIITADADGLSKAGISVQSINPKSGCFRALL